MFFKGSKFMKRQLQWEMIFFCELWKVLWKKVITRATPGRSLVLNITEYKLPWEYQLLTVNASARKFDIGLNYQTTTVIVYLKRCWPRKRMWKADYQEDYCIAWRTMINWCHKEVWSNLIVWTWHNHNSQEIAI